MKRIVIWGTGSNASKAMHRFPEGQATLLAFVDSDPGRQGMHFFDREILNPCALPDLKFDLLVVASYAFDSIRQMALALGIDGSKIVRATELFGMMETLPTRSLEHAVQSIHMNHREQDFGTDENIMVSLDLPAEGDDHTSCPICQGGFSPVYVNRHQRLIAECGKCGHHFVVNPWPELEVAGFYQGFGYFSQNYEHQGVHSLSEDSQWANWVSHRMAVLDTHCFSQLPGGALNILEQGCLEGRVLYALSGRGHKVIGCDVNAPVARAGKKHFGVDIRVGTIETCDLLPGSFDLIYSFHTLEHLRDPVRNLAATKALLKPGGMVFFEIPLNETAYENRDHLHFFSLDSVRRIMKSFFKNYAHETSSFRDAGGTVFESILVTAFKD